VRCNIRFSHTTCA